MTIALVDKLKERVVRALMQGQAPLKEALERSILINAKLLDKINYSKPVLPSLHEAEYRVFSQWGEDGIIAWLTAQLDGIPCAFVEFGVENYQESNTRYLLQSRNWRGLVIDGSQENIGNICQQDFYWRHELSAVSAFIDRDNINKLIGKNGFNGEIGLLSIDIDGNDYWIWQAIDIVNPFIVVCEYNAVLGDRIALTVPYKADFQRSVAHSSCLYFGASIRAMIQLGNKKGYTFVGTTSTGCNAFFVRNDKAVSIISKLGAAWAFPSKVREARDLQGQLLFVTGEDRYRVIANLPFIDLERNEIITLEELEELYSPEWKIGQKVNM